MPSRGKAVKVGSEEMREALRSGGVSARCGVLKHRREASAALFRQGGKLIMGRRRYPGLIDQTSAAR